MTISEEPSSAQSGSAKLEKSLDAVASLRKAMEMRLAQAKAEAEQQRATEEAAPPTVEPPPPPPAAPVAHDATMQLIPCASGTCDPESKTNPFFEPSLPVMGMPESEKAPLPPPPAPVPAPAPVVVATPVEEKVVTLPPRPVSVVTPPPAPEAPAAAPAPSPAPVAAEPKAEIKAEPKVEPKMESAQKPTEKPAAKPAEQPVDTHPLNFDPIEWSRIMYTVTTQCQRLYGEHLQHMRNRPHKELPISPDTMTQAMSELMAHMARDPRAVAETQMAMWQHYFDIGRTALQRMQDFMTGAPLQPPPKVADKRFQSPEWHTNWLFDVMRQTYQTTTEEMFRLIKAETANVENKTAQKIEFFTRLMLDATAPSNFWMTNPEVLRETWNTRGENLVKGFGRYLEDVERGNGILRMRMSDYQAFQLGKNIAATPGKVVFQNELMQLIQYAPSTPTVKSVPLLIMPPWINKFYILDLKDKNSYVRYAVGQGYTVFMISWRNPDKEQAGIKFEDYIRLGSLAAMREIKRITGEKRINTAAYCVGGTMQACTLAILAKMKDNYPADLPQVESSTFLTSLVDFEQPGELGVFIDEDQITMLERRMEKQGYFDACSLMMTFNLLRSKELFWPFFVNNYLMGREPFPFDILYWNTDSTNLPATMHSYYLRNMYLHNRLVQPDALVMLDTPIDLSAIETPCYFLSTREDHIAPWKSTYAATQLFKGPLTFVLSGSGHIAGVVNPPAANKYGYWTNEQLPADCDEWLNGAAEQPGSWWPHWTAWLDRYSSYTVPARDVADGIEDAPGSYVRAAAL